MTFSAQATGTKITGRTPRESTGRPELTEAAIVVSGGRGERRRDFAIIEALADRSGAAVGASRAPPSTPAGTRTPTRSARPASRCSPQLYIANGILRRHQHRAGMQASKTIRGRRQGRQAPIFELVDFGVVGDLFGIDAATDRGDLRPAGLVPPPAPYEAPGTRAVTGGLAASRRQARPRVEGRLPGRWSLGNWPSSEKVLIEARCVVTPGVAGSSRCGRRPA